MQQEDDLRALAKIMDFLRAVSIILVVMNVYWYCYETVFNHHVNIGVVDRILMNFNRTAGLFHSILYSKLFAVLLLALSCMGTKGVKGEKLTWRHIGIALAVGFVLFFLNWWLLALPLPADAVTALYVLTTAAGFIGLLMGGLWMSRLLKDNLMDDVFNNENESFMQETRLMVNDYSVNLPTRFYYRKKWHEGWINVVNPFRATIVLGTPGSGKSYAVVNNFIKQQIEKGYSMYVYDFKFPDLSMIAYNHSYSSRLHDGHIGCLRECIHHHAQPQQDVGAEAGRLLRRVAYHPLCRHHLVSENLREREVLHFPPCHRISQPQVRGYFSYSHQLSRTGELPFSLHGRMARRCSRAVAGTDCQCQDTAVTNDLPTTLLGDERQRVYA